MINCNVCDCKHNSSQACNLQNITISKNNHEPCRAEDTECNSFSMQ